MTTPASGYHFGDIELRLLREFWTGPSHTAQLLETTAPLAGRTRTSWLHCGRRGGMVMQRRWFLSYNSQDLALIRRFEAALRHKDAEARIFFAPASLRAGGYWLPELAREIAEATAFVLLVGEHGLGPWQLIEYYEALDRRVKQSDFA